MEQIAALKIKNLVRLVRGCREILLDIWSRLNQNGVIVKVTIRTHSGSPMPFLPGSDSCTGLPVPEMQLAMKKFSAIARPEQTVQK